MFIGVHDPTVTFGFFGSVWWKLVTEKVFIGSFCKEVLNPVSLLLPPFPFFPKEACDMLYVL